MKQDYFLIKRAFKYKNLFSQIVELITHKVKINTSPIDYYRYEFYFNKSWEEKSRYVGKRSSHYYPWQSNSVEYFPIFDNKYIFSTMLSGLGIPHPKLLTTIGVNYEIKNLEQLKIFLDKNKSDIVLKPLDGSGGEGVILLNYKEGTYWNSDGPYHPDNLWEQIKLGGHNPHPYLIEEKVEQDKAVSDIYPHSLNTLRVFTIKTKDNKWHHIGTFMRIGQSGHIDNLGAGGIHLAFNSAGKSCFAFDWNSFKRIEKHPVTDAALINIEVPYFKEAISLALMASEKFSFMGTIGWDIGLSVNGPTIIEGNMFWDCLYWQTNGQPPLIPANLSKQLDSRKWWHRWDKTHVHPRVDRYKIRA
jgi:hypothetical protein